MAGPDPRLLERIEAWRVDPVLFAVEALGIVPWDDGSGESQADLLRACASNPSVAVRSGHKTGKTTAAAILTLWVYALWPGARVIFTAPTGRQVSEVLYREIRRLFLNAKVDLGGRAYDTPSGGLRHPSGAQAIGFATDDPDRFSGISGAFVVYIVDEASGVDQVIFDALEGNRAGGAALWMFGNPTQTSGAFFAAFYREAALYRTLHISSERAAAYNRDGTVRGLATQEWVDKRRVAWHPAETDPRYAVRVRGDFPTEAGSTVIPFGLVRRSMNAWSYPARQARYERLTVGIDCARFGDDRNAVLGRRGDQTYPVVRFSGLDSIGVAQAAAHTVDSMVWPGEGLTPGTSVPVIAVDVIGIGAGVYDQLRALSRGGTRWKVVPCNVGERADDPEAYVNLRAQLAFETRDWLSDGGLLPEDEDLQEELVAAQYQFDKRGRIQVEAKDRIKARIGRSPDSADALSLAVYAGLGRAWLSDSGSVSGNLAGL